MVFPWNGCRRPKGSLLDLPVGWYTRYAGQNQLLDTKCIARTECRPNVVETSYVIQKYTHGYFFCGLEFVDGKSS